MPLASCSQLKRASVPLLDQVCIGWIALPSPCDCRHYRPLKRKRMFGIAVCWMRTWYEYVCIACACMNVRQPIPILFGSTCNGASARCSSFFFFGSQRRSRLQLNFRMYTYIYGSSVCVLWPCYIINANVSCIFFLSFRFSFTWNLNLGKLNL